MKLYLVHCGFYDTELCEGLYEGHVNLFVVAENFEEAKKKVRLEPDFKKKKMHVDGLQEVEQVNGYRVQLSVQFSEDLRQLNQTVLNSNLHRDL